MTTRAVDNAGCCDIHSPKTKKMTIGAAALTALVSAILIGLGAAGILPPAGNLAAIGTGSVLLAASIATIVIVLCMKKRVAVLEETYEEWIARKQQEGAKELLETIKKATPSQELIWHCIERKSLEAFKTVLNKVDPETIQTLKDSLYGHNIWHHIAFFGTPEMIDYLRHLNIHFGDTPSDDNRGNVIHWAVEGDNPEVIPKFKSLGADVHWVDFANRTALYQASATGKLGCVKALVEAGATISLSKTNEGYTFIEYIKKYDGSTPNYRAVAGYLAEKFPKYKAELGVKS